MLTQGKAFVSSGNIASARFLFEDLAAKGSGLGAFALGQTFDPNFLQTIVVVGARQSNPEEAKKFLKFILSGQPLLDYSMAVPGHNAPPIKEIQAQVLQQDHPYVNEHRDWIESIFEAVTYANHEVQNMGSITDDCRFEKSMVPMPWSARVMGQEPVVSRMFQEISLQNRPVEEAYQAAVERFASEMAAWKQENTWFTAPDPNWQPPGSAPAQ